MIVAKKEVRDYLTASKIGRFAINPYVGCPHACKLWGCATICAMALSIYLITKAMRTIPLGTAYAVWTGMGAVGAVLLGIIFFKEPATFWRLFFIFTLVASIIGLKIVS